jgi:hypothetical protein
MAERTVVAQIPAGQTIDLFGAVGSLLDAALGGALLAAGNGHDIAGSVVLPDDVTTRDAIARLRAAARILSKRRPKVRPEDMPDEVEDPGVIGPITEEEGGLTFRVGGAVDETREMMRILLASIVPAFEESQAPNYLEFPAVDEATGKRYAVIVVKPGGLTPHQARQRVETEAAQLRARLAELESGDA